MGLKYYRYISDTKVNMLYPQIRKGIRDHLKSVGFDVNLRVVSISTKLKEAEEWESKLSKLHAIINYLVENDEVGTVDSPKEYFKGTVQMRQGPYGGPWYRGLVYFGGYTDQTVIGLGGSLNHVIGDQGTAQTHSQSNTPYLLKTLTRELQLPPSPYSQSTDYEEEEENDVFLENNFIAVCIATKQMKGPKENFEFIAKRLLYNPNFPQDLGHFCCDKRKVLLGSPIYVSLSD